MISDTVLLAIIAAIPGTIASCGAIIATLRAHQKIDRVINYDEGATDARLMQQRKTDKE